MFPLGLDVHQNLIVYTWMDSKGNDVEQGSLGGLKGDLLELLDRVGSPVHVALEASGSTFWIHDVLVERLGAEFVHVAQSKRIRAKKRRLGCKGKARVAGARKLAEAIGRLRHWGECFDVARPFGGVPTEVR